MSHCRAKFEVDEEEGGRGDFTWHPCLVILLIIISYCNYSLFNYLLSSFTAGGWQLRRPRWLSLRGCPECKEKKFICQYAPLHA